MDIRTQIFLAGVATIAVVLVAILARSYRRARRSTRRDWEHLLGRLVSVDRTSIAEIALDVIEESGEPRRDGQSAALEPAQIWKLLGGMEGLEHLEANSAVLIDLAFYLQRWYPEALLVAEQLRLSAREIQWHLERLRGAQKTGKLESVFPMYAQRAAATYYLMTRRLLALYQRGNGDMLDELEEAI